MRTSVVSLIGILPLLLACGGPRRQPEGAGRAAGGPSDSGAARGAAPSGQRAAPDTSAAWLLLEKTGGIAGFRLSLQVSSAGDWTARDLARDKERKGTYQPAAFDSIRTALVALPERAWGSFPSTVVDDFHYRLVQSSGADRRVLSGGGTALPPEWEPIWRMLERPFEQLFAGP